MYNNPTPNFQHNVLNIEKNILNFSENINLKTLVATEVVPTLTQNTPKSRGGGF